MKAANGSNDSRSIGLLQQRFQGEEFRACVRALLMTPLMGPAHESFVGVRRQAEALREWFSREAGWILQVEREGARLYKRPGDLADAMRGLPGYDRRCYVLLCLACAVLERADPQITLRLLGERLLELAAEPTLMRNDAFWPNSHWRERGSAITAISTGPDCASATRSCANMVRSHGALVRSTISPPCRWRRAQSTRLKERRSKHHGTAR